jgi:hypothetical protein
VTVPNSDILAAQQAGIDAYQSGTSGRENPYRMSTDGPLCIAWIRGYNAARTERAREIEREQAS